MSVPITSIVFQNSGVFSLEGGITTFGQTFLAGALRPGQTLLAEIGGQLVPVQVDVRNTHPDGSVKMAVLTMERPDLAPWQSAEAVLIAGNAAPAAPAVSLPGVLAGHSATLSLAIEGRAPLAIDVGKAVTEAIAAGTASFWQQGPLATQARVEIPLDNTSMRIVLDVTGYADGELRFTVGLNNDRAMEAVGGRLDYTAKVVLDGATLFEQSLSHHQYQRVALDFASSDKHGIQGLGAPDAGWLNIKHDIEYLKATNAVFQFNTEFEADPGRLRAYYDQITTDPRWGEVFWHHGVETYMPKTGGRPDIGFTTQANAHWLLSQDAAAGEYALAQARVAGYVPWNFYDLANGTVLNADAYPLLWTDPRGGTGRPGDATSRGLTQQVAASSETGWTPDRAHMPDLSFVPYLLTGERWIYDNVMTQASFSIMRAPSSAVGANGERLVIEGSQLRDGAWSMRQIEHAAWIAEDGSAEQAYFTQAAKENWDRILSMAPAWTETWGELAGFIPSSIHITYNGGEFPIWQTNMLAGVVALAAARGSEEARGVLDFMGNHLLGLVQSADKGFDPHNAAGYYTPFFVDGKPLTTWSAVADALKAKGAYTDSFKGGGEEYQRLMLASLSMAYHATGDERYREAAESFLKLAPPGATTAIYANLAQFAVTIPELHELYRADPRAPAAGFDPVTLVLGTGPDEIRLSISQDYYAGPVQYRIFIDGQQIGGTLTASALKSRSEADLVVLRGDFPDTLSLRVQMINDTYQGSTAQDRNLYVNAVSYNGVELPVRMALLNNTAQEASLSAGGRRWDEPPPSSSEPPATPEPPPSTPPVVAEPDPAPTETIVFALNPRNQQSQGVLSVEANGERVFEGVLAAANPASPWTVALEVATGESTEFVLSYARSGVSSLPLPGPALVGVAHDGIALPTLSHNFPPSGVFRFTLHNGRPEDGVMPGSAGTDVFMLTGPDARVTTGAGRDLLVVRDQGHYRVADFDASQDRLMFEGMAAASLEATRQGQDMVIRFAGGSVVLEKTGLLALDAILLNAAPQLA
jgi:hypothetical protein